MDLQKAWKNLKIGIIFRWWLTTLHSTITWLTLTRSLGGPYGQIKTLTLYSDPNHNQNPNPNPNPNPKPNEKFDILPFIAMSRDATWPMQFFAYNFSGKHFNHTSCGVIRRFGISVQKYVDWTWYTLYSIFWHPELRYTLNNNKLMIKILSSVLNHSTFEFQDFYERAPGSWHYILVYKIPYRRARAWPSGCRLPSASREQRYLAYKLYSFLNYIVYHYSRAKRASTECGK